MNWDAVVSGVGAFTHEHRDLIELMMLYLVRALPPELPWPLSLIPPAVWVYAWLRAALMSLFETLRPDQWKKPDPNTQHVEVEHRISADIPVKATPLAAPEGALVSEVTE